ncbi:uncharacterized protein [Fopius arisanus]|uniref:Uncharacterized protein n=1 Tax=Fopius arisanus TaxID=64838 RepID=A0A9R1TPF4_9HYME|nr:PREDICTED: uncharacterized protein LOC105272484 [Fopius arisanus]
MTERSINKIARCESLPVKRLDDLTLGVDYQINAFKSVNTKYGRRIVATLAAEHDVFLPARESAALLDDHEEYIYHKTLLQVEHATTKASGVQAALSRLMPNAGGPSQRRRALLASVSTSVLTYGIAIWSEALHTQVTRRRMAAGYRLSAIRVASAYRTVSDDAIGVIAAILPVEILAEERRFLYRRRERLPCDASQK